jgi:anti-anti-sigma regulatory factor
MLRITTTNENTPTVSLKVEGQIASDWVATLQCECNQLLQSGKEIRLDFSAVTFVNAKGVGMLKKLLTRNVRITRSSELIQSLLCEEELP